MALSILIDFFCSELNQKFLANENSLKNMCSTQILGSNKDVVSKVKEKTKRKKMHCNEFDLPELVISFLHFMETD